MLWSCTSSAIAFLLACGDPAPGRTDASVDDVDARAVVDASHCDPGVDAPGGPAPVCLALEPGTFVGTTPVGEIDAALLVVYADDCITISRATIAWIASCGELATLTFPYPVSSESDGKRHVSAGTFETAATFQGDTTMVRVDVTHWDEGETEHPIDITITFIDPRYDVPPLVVRGTFCEWRYLLC